MEFFSSLRGFRAGGGQPFYEIRQVGGHVVAFGHGSVVPLDSSVGWALLSIIAAVVINAFYWPRFIRYRRGDAIKIGRGFNYAGDPAYERSRARYVSMSIPVSLVTALTVIAVVVWALGFSPMG